MTIQDVSRRSGLSEPTLRYYEEVGLIGPIGRDASSGHRRYRDQDLDTLQALACLRFLTNGGEVGPYVPEPSNGISRCGPVGFGSRPANSGGTQAKCRRRSQSSSNRPRDQFNARAQKLSLPALCSPQGT